MNEDLMIGCYRLHLTCGGCPEQYDVYEGDQQVAYLRLRHGYFRADVPCCGGDTVYEAYPQGDGVFMNAERKKYLIAAIAAVDAYRSGAYL